jgi:hypothetical protein
VGGEMRDVGGKVGHAKREDEDGGEGMDVMIGYGYENDKD